MNTHRRADDIDAALLKALVQHPDATNLALADATGLARNTVRARLARYAADDTLRPFDRRIDPAFLGFPMQAFVMTTVRQRNLAGISSTLSEIPEVLEVHGLSGVADLLVHVVARDADDLYRIAGRILDIEGVKRTVTGLVMGEFVEYQIAQLIGSPTSGAGERQARDSRRATESVGRIVRG
jgi:DNA-binding Lrp family transcriptional regulator